jgi:hypothetical protein
MSRLLSGLVLVLWPCLSSPFLSDNAVSKAVDWRNWYWDSQEVFGCDSYCHLPEQDLPFSGKRHLNTTGTPDMAPPILPSTDQLYFLILPEVNSSPADLRYQVHLTQT